MLRFEHVGKLTAGYYNDMEAGYPIFIDGECLSELVKDWLRENGISDNVCYGPLESSKDVRHPLIGKRVRFILEIGDD